MRVYVCVCLRITHTCVSVRSLICPFHEKVTILEQLAEDVVRDPLSSYQGEILNQLN